METYTPKFLKPWIRAHNYGGKSWDGYYSAGFGRTRDCNVLDRSNFDCAWKALSEVSDRVEIVHEGHWACGWLEWIAIPADDTAALKAADDMQETMEDYPVLDENDLAAKEEEEANGVWADCYNTRQRIEYIRANPDQFESLRSLADLLGCVRGRYFSGYASELL